MIDLVPGARVRATDRVVNPATCNLNPGDEATVMYQVRNLGAYRVNRADGVGDVMTRDELEPIAVCAPPGG